MLLVVFLLLFININFKNWKSIQIHHIWIQILNFSARAAETIGTWNMTVRRTNEHGHIGTTLISNVFASQLLLLLFYNKMRSQRFLFVAILACFLVTINSTPIRWV